jgi:DNA-directed RNA polymerase specialized sigma24 family protein
MTAPAQVPQAIPGPGVSRDTDRGHGAAGAAGRPGLNVRDDPRVIALVSRAASGDQGAWNDLVERYAPLVWSICSRYRLCSQDIEDVGQTVWLRLVEQLGKLRAPAALPGWIATTTQRECVRVLRAACRLDHAVAVPDHLESLAGPELIEPAALTITASSDEADSTVARPSRS